MSNPWFRMYHEFATDPKVQMLSESDQRRFVMLLCLRCSNGDVTLQDDEIAFQLRVSNDDWAQTKAVLMGKGLIDEDGKPCAWEKRQFASDSSAARVRKHREKKKRACNVTETKSNAPDTDTDTDTDKNLPAKKFAEDDLKLAEFILDRVLQVAPKTKAPNLDKWADTIRLMREQDNLTLREIAEVFAWANRDSFWKTNILSPAKLREKFSQLAAKMEAPTNAKPDKSDLEDQRMREYWESKRAGNHGNPAGAESVAGSPMLGWDQ